MPPVKLEDLTTKQVDGSGVFDALMTSFGAHLRNEYEKGRIAGADYTKTYIALSESAMSQAVAFLLGKDQAFWQAQQAQLGALTARVQLETAKIQAASVQLEALNQKANFALTKMKVATEEVGYCSAKYNLEVMLPEQLLTVQKANATATYNLATMLPQQLLNLQGQQTLIKEQMEAQRGQTLDLRSDGATVMGVMGQQKLLYAQQITSYKRDAEVKAAKLFTDAWITQKTMDEGLLPPTGFTNASIDTILTALKLNNDLD
ncbi:hypothetical protein D3C85_662400 [compost metagenome]